MADGFDTNLLPSMGVDLVKAAPNSAVHGSPTAGEGIGRPFQVADGPGCGFVFPNRLRYLTLVFRCRSVSLHCGGR